MDRTTRSRPDDDDDHEDDQTMNGDDHAADAAPTTGAGPARMTAKAFRAQETRWRFLVVRTRDNTYHRLEMGDRTKAKAFAEHLILTGAARKVTLTDVNDRDSGIAWASMPDR